MHCQEAAVIASILLADGKVGIVLIFDYFFLEGYLLILSTFA